METRNRAKTLYTKDFQMLSSEEMTDCVVHILCSGGEGRFVHEGREFIIAQNDVAIISNPQLVTDLRQSEDLQVEIIAATSDFLNRQLPTNNYGIGGAISLFDNPVIHVSDENSALLHEDMQAIKRRADETEHPFYDELMGSLALTMMYDLFAFHTKERSSVYASDRSMYVVKELMNMLAAGHSRQHRRVDYYAAQLSVTPKYLSDTVRRQTGHSVTYFIARYTVPIIKEYLNNPHLSIAQISEEMKFGNPASFTRYASRYLGMTPKHYRASLIPK